jgi:hypothetical protein
VASVPQENLVSYSLDTSGTLKRRQVILRRPYRTIMFGLMIVTSTIATLDLYLFASSGFH